MIHVMLDQIDHTVIFVLSKTVETSPGLQRLHKVEAPMRLTRWLYHASTASVWWWYLVLPKGPMDVLNATEEYLEKLHVWSNNNERNIEGAI